MKPIPRSVNLAFAGAGCSSRRRNSCAGEASAVGGVRLAMARHLETGVVLARFSGE